MMMAVAALLCINNIASAGVLFAYDASVGQFPTDQGWQGFDIDTTGPLTAPNTTGTTANNANAAIEQVDGMNALHIRDTLTDGPGDLPNYYYEWTTLQQQKLLKYGLKFTMEFKGLTTTSSGKGNVRFGFNNTEFEIKAANINADNAIEVLGMSSELASLDGSFRTLEILGQKNGANFEFSFSVDGGTSTPLNVIVNPSLPLIESTVYFGANSSPNRGTDFLVKSVVVETISVPEPNAILVCILGLAGFAASRRNPRTN